MIYVDDRRTREIGVRVALGADRASVRRMIVWGALRPVVAGLGVGLTGAAALSSLLSGMLFGVPRVDPARWSCWPRQRSRREPRTVSGVYS